MKKLLIDSYKTRHANSQNKYDFTEMKRAIISSQRNESESFKLAKSVFNINYFSRPSYKFLMLIIHIVEDNKWLSPLDLVDSYLLITYPLVTCYWNENPQKKTNKTFLPFLVFLFIYCLSRNAVYISSVETHFCNISYMVLYGNIKCPIWVYELVFLSISCVSVSLDILIWILDLGEWGCDYISSLALTMTNNR